MVTTSAHTAGRHARAGHNSGSPPGFRRRHRGRPARRLRRHPRQTTVCGPRPPNTRGRGPLVHMLAAVLHLRLDEQHGHMDAPRECVGGAPSALAEVTACPWSVSLPRGRSGDSPTRIPASGAGAHQVGRSSPRRSGPDSAACGPAPRVLVVPETLTAPELACYSCFRGCSAIVG